jgi:hypothetical protein
LVIISYTTGLSFVSERIGPFAAIIITVFYLLALYLFALPNTPENPFASIYSESLIKTTCQYLLLLVGFDTLIYRKYYDTPPILVDHHGAHRRRDVPAAATSASTVVLGRPPIFAIHQLCRGVHQQGKQDGDHRPTPASTGQQETTLDSYLRFWSPFFDSGMAPIAFLSPSGLFPGGEVAGGHSWARRSGGD